MTIPITVDDLVQLVRDDLDESNVTDVSQALILRKLNRAQRTAMNKIVPNYDELMLTSVDVTTTGVSEIAMPDNIYGHRIEHINQVINGQELPGLKRVGHREAARFNTTTLTNRPSHYSIKHTGYRIHRTPASGLTLRVYYTRLAESFVLSQGRVTGSGTDATTSQPYVSLNAVGSSLTTENTNLYNYVNLINHRTGAVKATLQIASIDTANKRVLFKIVGLGRSTVLGKTIDIALPENLAPDDYLSVVHGTCVPEIPEAYLDYLVQHAVVTVKRAKQEPTNEDYADLKDQESDVKNMWIGRESKLRIKKNRR